MSPVRMICSVGCALSLLGPVAQVTAQERQGPIGYLDPARDAALLASLKDHAPLTRADVLRPVVQEKEVSHVVNGIALRDRARGYIHSRGVAQKSEIVRSLLLWNLSDQKREGAASAPVLFDGNLVVGKKTADNTDPCWGHAGNHSYLADVTRFTNQAGGSNQEYEVVLPFFETTSTSGLNPWAGAFGQETLLEGASLIVIYRNEATRGALFVFAPPGDNMFVGSASYVLPTPGLGTGLFSLVGADGQRGAGHDNAASNEETYFDGTQIAGPPVAASDWDGSDGLTLPQLWDSHTHIVKLSAQVAKVDYKGSFDCLVAVGFVLDQE